MLIPVAVNIPLAKPLEQALAALVTTKTDEEEHSAENDHGEG